MLREVIGSAGGGKLGNYSHCSFTVKGIGRFTPLDGAEPAIGSVNTPEVVVEERIEFDCDESHIKQIVKTIRENHPYEEPAIDVYPLADF